MKKVVKVIPIMLMIIMMLSTVSTVMAVTNPSDLKGTDVDTFENIGKNIIGLIQSIGSIVSVAILVVLGIKYMMGSAEEKAEYKKTLIPYLVGAILIFAASNIAGIVYNVANNITTNS